MPENQPPPARTYGAPIGYQPPDPNRQQKAATPATDAQVAKAYTEHMRQALIAAHNQFKQQQQQPQRVRGSSAKALGNKKPPAILDREIERQSK